MTVREVLSEASITVDVPEELWTAHVSGLEYDSRRVKPGYLFFAFPGAKADGRAFAASALEKGAVAVVSELPAPSDFDGAWITVDHGRRALATAARNFYRRPDERLALTGVTGTNGKTTTTYLIDSVLRHAGKTTALIGTIESRLGAQVLSAVNTTPESLDLFRIFHQLESIGGTHVTMEVSSHALALERVHGIHFHTAVFTNLTRDHLDFHGTMEAYFEAKRRLFSHAPFAVINSDDEYGRRIAPDKETQTLTYGFGNDAALRASDLEMTFAGLRFAVHHAGQTIALTSPMTGKINVYNILAASGAALSLGLDWDTIAKAIQDTPRVPGRFETV